MARSTRSRTPPPASSSPERDDLGPLPIELIPAGPNHYIANGLQIPYEGDWTLEVVATTADDATVRMTTTLDVDSCLLTA